MKFWVWILQHFQKEVSDDEEEEEEKLKSQNSRTEMDLHLSGTRVSTSSDAAGGPSALSRTFRSVEQTVDQEAETFTSITEAQQRGFGGARRAAKWS